jgi:hypothetical protein
MQGGRFAFFFLHLHTNIQLNPTMYNFKSYIQPQNKKEKKTCARHIFLA